MSILNMASLPRILTVAHVELEVGMMAKRILDLGRVAWLREAAGTYRQLVLQEAK